MNKLKTVLVVGAGLGGITTALRFAKKTYFLHKDLDKLAAQFAEEEPDFKEKMAKYLKKPGALYNDTVDNQF